MSVSPVNFILMHQSIVEYDAIGRDIVEMYEILGRRHGSYLYGEYLIGIGEKRNLSRDDLNTHLQDPSTVLVYHHSNYWEEGEAILNRTAGPIVFKYHNITPPRCFASYPDCWRTCVMGREQTLRFFHRFPQARWLTDSRFNLTELGLDLSERAAVLPPFPTMVHERAIQPDGSLLRQLIESRELNVLFSGRFVPNKGHKLMVRVIGEYVRRFGREIRLYIIGKLDPTFSSYHDCIRELMIEEGVEDRVCYLGSIPDTQLLACYLGCDAYLSCSDHEGFCVPVVEAQYCRLPVIAKARGAVPDTVGPGGLLFGDDPAPYAEAIYRLRTDEAFRCAVIAAGLRNCTSRFSYQRIEAGFRAEILKTTGLTL
jgi:glycosyltransferase involved in cell wall biosynthesis